MRTSVASVLLLNSVFDLNLAHCPNCGGELKIIAAVLEQPVIEKVLARLGLPARVSLSTQIDGRARRF